MSQVASSNRIAYEEDVAAWADEQAHLLRAGDLAALDLKNLAEEIESLGISQRSALRSRLAVLLQHLLKWKFQPERRSQSWRSSVRVQRRDIRQLLDDNPSLRRTLPEVLHKSYQIGREDALEETGVYVMPDVCPWTIEQVLATDFLPD